MIQERPDENGVPRLQMQLQGRVEKILEEAGHGRPAVDCSGTGFCSGSSLFHCTFSKVVLKGTLPADSQVLSKSHDSWEEREEEGLYVPSCLQVSKENRKKQANSKEKSIKHIAAH